MINEEVSLRNNTFIQSIKLLKAAREIALTLIEYPEMNVVVIGVNEALDDIQERLTAIAKTTDKNMMIRVNQIDSIKDGI